MTHPTILGIGTALPKNCYDQMEICTSLSPGFNSHRAPAVFQATEIESRHSVLDDLTWLLTNPSNGDRLKAYMVQALPLGVEAIQQALDQAQLAPAEVDDLIVASCTGVDTPSLDVKIADAMGMSPYLRRSSIVGMGCQALMPSLYQAANAVLVQPQRRVVVLTLELCTLHFQQGRTLKNMLGSALFGDGASAAVVANGGQPGPRLLDSLTYSNYQAQENMTFHPGDSGYQIALTNDIPDLIGEQAPPLVDCLLARHQLERNDVSQWVVHPGGMKILDSVEETLALSPQALHHSRTILRQYGNMSSATLLFVLKRVIEKSQPAAGEHGIIIGFGPGLTIEVGLIEW
jgi:predicted naringenin-chalcone synthase